MSQASLFAEFVRFGCQPIARNSDPITSHAAADAAKALIADHEAKIFKALKSGPAGKDGIAARCSLTGTQIGKRLRDMARSGLIRETGALVKSAAGRHETQWEAVA